MKLKRTFVAVAASAVMLGTMAVPTFAASGGNNASDCGATHGAFANVNGNFG